MYRNNSNNGTGKPSCAPFIGRSIVRKIQCAGGNIGYMSSMQSIVFLLASVVIWLLGILSFFKPEYRQNIFYIIVSIV